MFNATTQIAQLSARMKTPLNLDNGVCAVFDEKTESVIIEALPASELVVLHRKLYVAAQVGRGMEQLLRMNFDLSLLKGCWLAQDGVGDLRLCTQLPTAAFPSVDFVRWVEGFATQAKRVNDTLDRKAGITH